MRDDLHDDLLARLIYIADKAGIKIETLKVTLQILMLRFAKAGLSI